MIISSLVSGLFNYSMKILVPFREQQVTNQCMIYELDTL